MYYESGVQIMTPERLSRKNLQRRQRSAFTLVELLVVIAILAVLASLLFPALSRARDNARRVQCGLNLRQIAMVAMAFARDNREFLPAMSGRNPVHGWLSENPNGYDIGIELQLYSQGKGNIGYSSDWTPWGKATKGKEWLCPTMGPKAAADGDMRRVGYGPNSYAWSSAVMRRFPAYKNNYTIDGYPTEGRRIRADQVAIRPAQGTPATIRGPATTVMFGERLPTSGNSYVIGHDSPYPEATPDGDGRISLRHSLEPRHGPPRDGFVGRGFNFVFFDGHVQYDPDYRENYSTDLASLMWGYFLWP